MRACQSLQLLLLLYMEAPFGPRGGSKGADFQSAAALGNWPTPEVIHLRCTLGVIANGVYTTASLCIVTSLLGPNSEAALTVFCARRQAAYRGQAQQSQSRQQQQQGAPQQGGASGFHGDAFPGGARRYDLPAARSAGYEGPRDIAGDMPQLLGQSLQTGIPPERPLQMNTFVESTRGNGADQAGHLAVFCAFCLTMLHGQICDYRFVESTRGNGADQYATLLPPVHSASVIIMHD